MVRKALPGEEKAVASLAHQLWPAGSLQEFTEEFEELLLSTDCCVFLAFHGAACVGFAQCQLRRDYVEGTDSSPVGYLEGIYVSPAYEKQGYGRRLLAACEQWARESGCTEFASDCPLENRQSLAFHLAAGFTEANRIICFVKKL
ncbi:MAG: GNAT family N-acetyltransferase [Oscillospiraceae bacterium]|nr:GNAT family N-acetyltransferase [Oscillospiraceae bacterium]